MKRVEELRVSFLRGGYLARNRLRSPALEDAIGTP
jgi:hypothetical protein